MAATTQQIYLQAVRFLAKHYNRSPELLAEEEVRRYLLDVFDAAALSPDVRGALMWSSQIYPQPATARRAITPTR